MSFTGKVTQCCAHGTPEFGCQYAVGIAVTPDGKCVLVRAKNLRDRRRSLLGFSQVGGMHVIANWQTLSPYFTVAGPGALLGGAQQNSANNRARDAHRRQQRGAMGPRGGRGRRLAKRSAACVDELGVARSSFAAIDWRSPESLACIAKWRETKCTVRLVTGPSRSPQENIGPAEGGRGGLKRRDGLAHGGDGAAEIAAPRSEAEQSQQLAGLLSPSSALGRRCETRECSPEGSGGALSTAPTGEVASALPAEAEEQELACGSEAGQLRQRGLAGRVQDAAARGARAVGAVELAEAEGRAAVATESTECILALAAEKAGLLRSALARAAAAEAAAAEQRRVAAAAQAEVQQMRLRLQGLGAEHAAALRGADELRDGLHAAAAARHAAQRRHADSERRAELAGRAAAQLQLQLSGLGEQHSAALRELEALRASARSRCLVVAPPDRAGAGGHCGADRRERITRPNQQPAAERQVAGDHDVMWPTLPLGPLALGLVAGSDSGRRRGRRSLVSASQPVWGGRNLTPRTHSKFEVLRIDSVAHRIALYCPGYWAQACSTFAEAAFTTTRMYADGLDEMSQFCSIMQTPKAVPGRHDVSPTVAAVREFRELRQELVRSIRGLPVQGVIPLGILVRRLDMVIVIFEECRAHLADVLWDISPVLKDFKEFNRGVCAVLEARDARLAPPPAPSAPTAEPSPPHKVWFF